VLALQNANANTSSHRSIIEVDLGIICACIPTIKPLFNRKFTEKKTTAASYSADSNNTIGSRSKTQSRTKTTSTMSLDEYPLTNLGDD
jgi:hypothetical protein